MRTAVAVREKQFKPPLCNSRPRRRENSSDKLQTRLTNTVVERRQALKRQGQINQNAPQLLPCAIIHAAELTDQKERFVVPPKNQDMIFLKDSEVQFAVTVTHVTHPVDNDCKNH